MTKAKLYELLSTLIRLDDSEICCKIYESKILNYLLIDIDQFEDNTNILLLLTGIIK